jgi:ubiquitin-conjugating enzyme E2 D/E
MVPGGGALRRTTTTGVARPADRSRPWETRLERELERLWEDPPEWCVPGADATDRLRWQVVVVGPGGSPYDGGVFTLRVEFPRDYPFKPPKVFFATKVRTRSFLCLLLAAVLISPMIAESFSVLC